jgi:hypothetical protein
MRLLATIFCIGTFLFPLHAQDLTQRIKGTVVDRDTRQPLIGAEVTVIGSDPLIGTITDELGNYVLEQVPVGRRAVRCQYLGYDAFESAEVIVNSAKEVVLDISLSEGGVVVDEVVVVGAAYASDPVNELAVVSARSFSVEETERIPASVNDLGRMALTFPGVQQGSDDAENEIIVRGNSSLGLLWRLEGIDIPNPNHFAKPGSSGGGITIFSAQLLSRSDFFSGAFPAEYGNALSGIFDVRFRKGNLEEREHRLKIGLLGMDFATEGPIKKGRSSYLINYRYSTLSVLNDFGFNLVGERVDNDFQDLSFNLNFESKDKKSFFTIFGMGGLSEEHYRPVEDPLERDSSRADHWEDRINESNMGAIGATYTRLINEKSYFKAVVAGMTGVINRNYDTLSLSNERYNYNLQQYIDSRVASALSYNYKFNARTRLKTGFIFNQIFYESFKETAIRRSVSDATDLSNFGVKTNGNGNTQTLQAYAQFTHRLSDKITLHGGAHWLYLTLNNTGSFEPRLSVKYKPGRRHTIGLAYGKHSKVLPFANYFYEESQTLASGDSVRVKPNTNLELIKSNHIIASYNVFTPSKLKFGIEIYYQGLRDVPVNDTIGNGTFWLLNEQGSLPDFALTSDGTGRNYGVDLSLEKLFSNQFYFLLTASFFNSEFEINDVIRNTRFNTRFSSTYTIGREFFLKNNGVLQAGIRVLFNGGFRYSPLDEARSLAEGRFIPLSGAEWSEQVDPYLRFDSRIAFRKAKKKYNYTVSLDIQNLTNRFNPHSVGYDVVTNSLTFRRHTGGLIPVLSYQMDF